MKKLLGVLIGVSLVLFIALAPAVAQTPSNTITFDNKSSDLKNSEPFSSKWKKCEKEPVQFLYLRSTTINFPEKEDNDSLKKEIINNLNKAGFQIINEKKELDPLGESCKPPNGFKFFTVFINDSLVVGWPYSGYLLYKNGDFEINKKLSGEGFPDDDVLYALDEILEIALNPSSH